MLVWLRRQVDSKGVLLFEGREGNGWDGSWRCGCVLGNMIPWAFFYYQRLDTWERSSQRLGLNITGSVCQEYSKEYLIDIHAYYLVSCDSDGCFPIIAKTQSAMRAKLLLNEPSCCSIRLWDLLNYHDIQVIGISEVRLATELTKELNKTWL